ncbi:ABC transporter permease subunit [Natrialba swarupiae]|nr:ABC transporter permease subunit [Natrialba swarupiae]
MGHVFFQGQSTFSALYEGIQSGWVIPNTNVTMQAVVISFLIATVIGGVTGLILGFNKPAYDIVEPFFLSFYSVPKITMYPIFLFIFGVGLNTKVGFATFSSFFPMLIITMGAVRSIDDVYINVGKSLQVSRYQMFRHIVLPYILVQLVVALRLTFNSAFLAVILVELFAARSGLGLVLQHAMGTFNSEEILIVVTVLAVIAFVINIIFYGAQQLLEERWNMTSDEQMGI